MDTPASGCSFPRAMRAALPMKLKHTAAVRGLFILCAVLVPGLCATPAADWPQYLGPRGDGTSEETQWNQDWSQKEPQMLWKAEVGTGCASFSIANGKAYTVGQQSGAKDTAFCLDAMTGKELWTFSYVQGLEPTYYSGGPSCTPTYDAGKLYVLGRDGGLFCLEADTGKVLWEKSYVKDFGGRSSSGATPPAPSCREICSSAIPEGRGAAWWR